MKTIAASALAILAALTAASGARAADGKIAIVAAENFYGDVARRSAATGSRSPAS